VTSIQIVEHLAQELSIRPEQVLSTLEMLDAGLKASFIGGVRREQSGGLNEHMVRRLGRRRDELEELDRRRGTILRLLETGESGPKADAAALERVRRCMDRFELEDLFLPHRRSEPEVQLALDRGLGRLADDLIVQVAREPDPVPPSDDNAPDAAGSAPEHAPEHAADEARANAAPASEEAHAAEDAAVETSVHADGAAHFDAAAHAEAANSEPSGAGESPAVDATASESASAESPEAGDAHAEAEETHIDQAPRKPEGLSAAEEAMLHGQIEVTPALARACEAYVSPDRGLHTEAEALAGAMRILSDRLARDARLRNTIRKMLRKNGVLSVRATTDEGRLGRHRSLLKLKQPLRQVQGNRLLAIRQAQKERAVTTVITLDRNIAFPKVRAALGPRTNPEFASVLDAVALRTLEHRLLPLIEADVRLELKERADDEALRFLSQHLRQVLMTPPLGHHPVAGVDISAKGDWTIAFVDSEGAVLGAPTRIELGEKDEATLAAELKAAFDERAATPPVALAIGHGKLARVALTKLRAVMRAAGLEQVVHVVNDSGVASYASSELARQELPEQGVPQRVAIALARRLQDPLSEILKVDPRHLGLGAEQGLVSKANLRRVFDETIESCVAHVGCELNFAPHSFLMHVPGLDDGLAKKLIARRAEKPFESREELRAEGLLSEVQWTNAVACLRLPGKLEPLDRTSLHPEQYEVARRVIEAGGGSVEDSLGRPGVTKGLRRDAFGIEDNTWRDLMRELWRPGSDPRFSLFPPKLLPIDTDRVTLIAGRAVDGVITNVASFGAFVDIGLEQDGMIHVSEIAQRYVRDARELVSIGETVRLRLVDASGPRVALSLKNVPEPERPPRPERAPRQGEGVGDERGGRRGGRRERGERREEPSAPVRAAVSRRDGLVPGQRGGGGRRGDRPGGGKGRGRDDRGRDRDEFVAPEDLRQLTKSAGYNPFASFFKKKG
jgi:uncharacterized protein